MENSRTDWERYALAFPLLLWFSSFFLPVIVHNSQDWFLAGMQRGYVAVALSFAAGFMAFFLLIISRGELHAKEFIYLLYVGSLWLANLWMIAAPWRVNRLRQARDRLFLYSLWVWVLLPIPFAWLNRTRPFDPNTGLHVGFYIWWASFLFLALLCTAFHSYSNSEGELLPYPPPPGTRR